MVQKRLGLLYFRTRGSHKKSQIISSIIRRLKCFWALRASIENNYIFFPVQPFSVFSESLRNIPPRNDSVQHLITRNFSRQCHCASEQQCGPGTQGGGGPLATCSHCPSSTPAGTGSGIASFFWEPFSFFFACEIVLIIFINLKKWKPNSNFRVKRRGLFFERCMPLMVMAQRPKLCPRGDRTGGQSALGSGGAIHFTSRITLLRDVLFYECCSWMFVTSVF